MDHDTKITLLVITLLIVLLGGLSLYLRDANETSVTTTDSYSTSTQQNNIIQQPSSTTPAMSTTTLPSSKKVSSATITTNYGTIEVQFATNTPVTVENFAKLASSGFYTGTRFHRVIEKFMIQGGDPLSKDPSMKDRWGTGGPEYRFKDELTGQETYPQGTLAMANAGPNTNGSQFFIVTASPQAPLSPDYTVFGHVTKGIDTALKIEKVATDANDRPLQDVIIQKIEVR